MSISLDDVNWFREVAKFGGISNAAAHHDTMRSTVSRRIQTLEHQLGFELFTRHARGLELTSKGKELLKTVEESLDFLNRVINTTAQEHKGLSGTIRIALPSALMTMPLVMDTIKRFASSSPESSIEIENYQETLDLSKYSIDIQLLPASEPFLNVPEDDINLLTFNNYFVATKDYLDANGTPNSLEELQYHRVITNRFNTPIIADYVERIVKSDDLSLLIDMTSDGSGIGFLPALTVNDLVKRYNCVHVLPDKIEGQQSLRLITAKGARLSPKVSLLVNFFKEAFSRSIR